MIEGSGSIPLTNGSGSGRPINMWIRWIRIRNTAKYRGLFCAGFPGSVSTAMRRWDHAPFFSMQQPKFIVPFYVQNDYSQHAINVNKRVIVIYLCYSIC
jgi:hypothetical protein